MAKPSRQKVSRRRKDQWDPIPVTYAELLPKLIDSGSIVPIQMRPRKPPFPKWYDVNIRCDYHSGVSGHSIEDCTIFKNKVQNLIEEGKIKFEKSDGPTEVEYPSREKAKMIRQEKEAPREAIPKQTAMPKEKVPIAQVQKNEAGSSSTTEWSKERSCEPNGEQEKNTLWDSAQGLERMFVEQNECVGTLIEEHHSRTFKQRRTLGSNKA